MAKISFTDGTGTLIEGTVNKEHQELTIGRGKGADLRVHNQTVSRKHCRIFFAEGSFYLEDLGSSNGTYYKGKKLAPRTPEELEDEDMFYAGNLEVKFVKEGEDYIVIEKEEEPPPAPHLIDEEDNIDDEGVVIEEPAEDDISEKTAAQAEPIPQSVPDDSLSSETVVAVEENEGSAVEFGDVHHEVIEHMDSINEDAQRKIDNLNQQLKEKDDIIAGLQRQVEELQDTVRSLQESSPRDEGEDLDKDELMGLLERTEADNLKLNDKIDELNNTIDTLKSQIADYEKQLQEQEAIQKRLDELKALKSESEAQVNELKVKLEDLQALIEEKDAMIEALQEEQTDKGGGVDSEEFERLLKEKEALLEENNRWEELKKQFEQDQADLKAENESLKEQLQRLKAEAGQSTELEKELKEAQARVDELAKSLESARLANRSYIKKVSRLLEENDALKAKTASGDTEILDAIRKENAALKTRIQEMEERLKRASEQMAKGTFSIDSLQDFREVYESLNEIVHQLETDMDVLVQLSDNDNLVSQVKQIEVSLNELKNEVKEMDNLLKTLEM